MRGPIQYREYNTIKIISYAKNIDNKILFLYDVLGIIEAIGGVED